jgi:hypothetical protein
MGLFVMRTRKQRTAAKRNSKRTGDHMHRMRMISQARRHGPRIETSVLRELAASGLPPSVAAYNAKLRELLQSAQ